MNTEQTTTTATTQDDSAREAARDLERARQELCSDLVRRNVHLCMSSWVDSLIKGSKGEGFDEEAHEHYYGDHGPDLEDVREACEGEGFYVVEWMDDDARTFQDADGNVFDLVKHMSAEDAEQLREDASGCNVAGWYVFNDGELFGSGRVDAFDDIDDATREAADRARVDLCDYVREIYEWWAIDSWFGRQLAERGEHVVDGEHGGSMWGRTCTGQAISMDGVIRRICAETWPEDWTPKPKAADWSGGPCDVSPDGCWIDDVTGEHVNATTGERTAAHP